MKYNFYLASPFFDKKELDTYAKVITYLRARGYEVFVPREHEIPDAWSMPESKWGSKVFDIDEEAIQNCDAVIVLNHGMYSDSGTAWEAGYAMALGKMVFQVLCGDANTVYSLMMIHGSDAVFSLDDLLNYHGKDYDYSHFYKLPTVYPRQK
jgi:nucleoside 2-deoxyribosyltransferase